MAWRNNGSHEKSVPLSLFALRSRDLLLVLNLCLVYKCQVLLWLIDILWTEGEYEWGNNGLSAGTKVASERG